MKTMKTIKTFEQFNEGLIKNVWYIMKLGKLLRNWQKKYQPEDYDKVINQAFDIIDEFNLPAGVDSPSFYLPNDLLETDFIKKFFVEADKRGYDLSSKKGPETTQFKLLRKESKFQRALKKYVK